MKWNIKRIFAILAVVLLGGLYVAALVLAILDDPISSQLLKGTFLLTLAVPVLLYIYTWLFKKAKERRKERETGIREIDKGDINMEKPNLIVMLTFNDRTVENAPEVFEKNKDSDAKFWGYKEIGLAPDKVKALCQEIKKSGKTCVLEVVAYTEAECLEGAHMAVDCGFDILMGTMFFDSINDYCKEHNLRYMPFVGDVHDRPSILDGTIDGMIAEAKEYIKKGAWGIDILAYRYTGDYSELIRRFVAEVDAPVCIAGSINSYERLDEIKAASPWGFTIGSAFFNKDFGDDFGEQVNNVCRYL